MTRAALATPDDDRVERELSLPSDDQVAILEHVFTLPSPAGRRRNRWNSLEIDINRVNEIRSRLLLVRAWHTRGGAR